MHFQFSSSDSWKCLYLSFLNWASGFSGQVVSSISVSSQLLPSRLLQVELGIKMKSLSSVGFGLGVAFGCLLLVLVAEVYYLLWWKKRKTNRDTEIDSNNTGKQLFHMFCEERPSSLRRTAFNNNPEGQVQTQTSRNFHSPGFLFTIEEETKEDSESESVNKSKSRINSSDSLFMETPYFTPLASTSPFFTPPLTPPMNPLLESADDAEFKRVKSSPPPPTFKFLQDAEEKLSRELQV